MAERSDGPVPRPTPLEDLPAPEPAPGAQAHPPAVLRLTSYLAGEEERLTVLFKRTFDFRPGRPCTLAEEQIPIHEEVEAYEELEPGTMPSWKTLPDLLAQRPGTDVIVQGNACSPKPVTEMIVAVEVGRRYVHRAVVTGRRRCSVSGRRVVFTPPEPFEEIALRYENAYGGGDPRFDEDVVEQLKRERGEEKLRKVKAVAEELFADAHPLMYPRNRFGKGYVVDGRPEWVEGRELPQLEWPEDRLTPDRLVVGNPLDWNKQPLPVGFDFLDPAAFPRSAMFGFPPPATETSPPFAEVQRGLVPSDFSRGNIFTASPEELPNLIHPWAGRSASLGLWLPFLDGNEAVVLNGMDSAHPRFAFQLPGEHPSFELPGMVGRGTLVEASLHCVHVRVAERVVTLLWAGHAPLRAGGKEEDLLEEEGNVVVYMARE